MGENHGGNIYRCARSYGLKEEEILDFSASINPLGLPASARSAMIGEMGRLVHYPDPDTRELCLKISEQTGIGEDRIICGNGSTELIYLIARALKPRRVLIPDPTFSEYRRACEMDRSVHIVSYETDRGRSFDVSPDEFLRAMDGSEGFQSQCDMAFLCNPNNPTGRLIPRTEMLRLAEGAKRSRSILIVDEAFIDFCPDATIIDEVERNPYLVVLRSLTKFYALSGLRIGYAAVLPDLAKKLRDAKEPWTVNTLAQKAAVAALDDLEYRRETFRVIEGEKKILEEGFRRLGIFYLLSAANFYLLKMEKGAEVRAALARKGILVRDCSNFAGLDGTYMRVAVKSRDHNLRLLEEMAKCAA
ncbi:MAG TPA: threonine-phosphate decarboxylase CobD [Syntrophorhabdaceae bacterium]|jgi:threonine-phosphate decarboxylase